jgi:hypothetical protein
MPGRKFIVNYQSTVYNSRRDFKSLDKKPVGSSHFQLQERPNMQCQTTERLNQNTVNLRNFKGLLY